MGRIGLIGTYPLSSAEETIAFARKLASLLPSKAIIALSGDLGAGKTTFVQGLALGLGIQEPIQSPTFVLLNAYQNLLYHFDLYRLRQAADFTNLGFEEYFHLDGICAIEWPDRIETLLPENTYRVEFSYDGVGRIIQVSQ